MLCKITVTVFIFAGTKVRGFEVFNIFTGTKVRGFVMVSYYSLKVGSFSFGCITILLFYKLSESTFNKEMSMF